jgi:hypothetical protein
LLEGFDGSFRAIGWATLKIVNTHFLGSDPDDSSFSLLLDLFLQADRVQCFSQESSEEQVNTNMEEMVAGRLQPAEVQELLGNIRSDPSAVARLATLLQKTKEAARE